MNGTSFWITYTLCMVAGTLALEYRALLQAQPNQESLQLSKLDYQAGMCKGLASLGFLIYFYQQSEWVSLSIDSIGVKLPNIALGLALLASAIGDLLLVGKREIFFLLGLIAFFIAHLAYALAFIGPLWESDLELINMVHGSLLLGIIFISLLAYRYFHPHIPKNLVYPAMAYTSVIGLMMSIALIHALTLQHYAVAIGALAFWFSDLAVAKQQFQAEDLPKNGFYVRLWGLPLYYVAQIILAGSIA